VNRPWFSSSTNEAEVNNGRSYRIESIRLETPPTTRGTGVSGDPGKADNVQQQYHGVTPLSPYGPSDDDKNMVAARNHLTRNIYKTAQPTFISFAANKISKYNLKIVFCDIFWKFIFKIIQGNLSIFYVKT
jgi:hypothetical protein